MGHTSYLIFSFIILLRAWDYEDLGERRTDRHNVNNRLLNEVQDPVRLILVTTTQIFYHCYWHYTTSQVCLHSFSIVSMFLATFTNLNTNSIILITLVVHQLGLVMPTSSALDAVETSLIPLPIRVTIQTTTPYAGRLRAVETITRNLRHCACMNRWLESTTLLVACVYVADSAYCNCSEHFQLAPEASVHN